MTKQFRHHILYSAKNQENSMAGKIQEVTQKLNKRDDPRRWVYRVRRNGNKLLVTVRLKTRFIIYPKPISPPLQVSTLYPDESLELVTGEWCELYYEGHWYYPIDADNRVFRQG